MSESGFQTYAAAKGFHPQTLVRWLSWPAEARAVLAQLALDLKIGENQLRDLMDWGEEIALRDGIAVEAIFAGKAINAIATDPRLGRADKVKRIKESLRRLRFPRLAQAEDEIHGKIRALKLQPEIRITVPPGLEGGKLQIEFTVTNQRELKRLVEKLAAAAETNSTSEIFSLLGGSATSVEPA